MLRCPLLAAALLCAGILQGAEDPGRVTVFLFSIDGIRPDDPARSETPFFDQLMAEGVYSLEVIPPFPSGTFSSHATLAGLFGIAPAQGADLEPFLIPLPHPDAAALS